MARIKTYGLDSEINPADKVIGTDGKEGVTFGDTKNYSISNLKTYFNEGSTLIGWARYDGDASFSDDSYYNVSDGNSVKPNMALVANNADLDLYSPAPDYKFEFTNENLNEVYMLTIVFKASAANANQTHVDVSFLSGSTDYERLTKSIGFYKGNDVVQNFHEVFQFYVDSDLVTYGLIPTIDADGGDIKVGDVIYFIQKTQGN